jgi:toxin ParE1/3/4
MKFEIVFKPEARLDIMEIRDWYETNKANLGETFIKSFFKSIDNIHENPKLYPDVYKNIRKCIIRNFPYSIFYIIAGKKVVILSCMHFKRNPKTWKSRAK